MRHLFTIKKSEESSRNAQAVLLLHQELGHSATLSDKVKLVLRTVQFPARQIAAWAFKEWCGHSQPQKLRLIQSAFPWLSDVFGLAAWHLWHVDSLIADNIHNILPCESYDLSQGIVMALKYKFARTCHMRCKFEKIFKAFWWEWKCNALEITVNSPKTGQLLLLIPLVASSALWIAMTMAASFTSWHHKETICGLWQPKFWRRMLGSSRSKAWFRVYLCVGTHGDMLWILEHSGWHRWR